MPKSQIICAKSGLLFSCDFLPIALKQGEMMHPFFYVSRKNLLANAGKWANMEFSPEENYLYFLSLLDSSGLIIWRATARYTPEVYAMALAHTEKLLLVMERMTNLTKEHLSHLPEFSINPDTSLLETIPYFIDAWNASIDESLSGYKTVGEIYDEQAREDSIAKLIKSPYRTNDRELAWKLAEWADGAGNFPKFLTQAPNGKHTPLNELWKEIIKACVDDDRIHHIPRNDMEELIEHVIDNIPQGTIHSSKLLHFLRVALAKKADMQSLGFGNENLAGKTTSFTIIANDNQRAGAFLNTLIAQAPVTEPKRSEFKSLADYIRAKSKWNLAQAPKETIASGVSGYLNAQIVDDREVEEPTHNPDNFTSEDDLY